MSGDYEIGYGKPPKRNQFKEGESGNPKGRPKGTKNLKTDLMEELSEMISLREGSKEMRVSKQRGILKSHTAKAVQGDARSAALIINMVWRLLADDDDEPDEIDLAAADRKIMEAYASRNTRKQSTHSDSKAGRKTQPRRRGKRGGNRGP
jgi:hypothetical protein